jgi:hypothetical protein
LAGLACGTAWAEERPASPKATKPKEGILVFGDKGQGTVTFSGTFTLDVGQGGTMTLNIGPNQKEGQGQAVVIKGTLNLVVDEPTKSTCQVPAKCRCRWRAFKVWRCRGRCN